MRIAQVAPLWESVPPPGYGGIELVVSYLCDELTRRGHQVTLFASGDSKTLAQLNAVFPHALRLDPTIQEYVIYDLLQMQHVSKLANQFDVIHFHNGYNALPVAETLTTPVVHTLHGRFSSDNQHLFRAYAQQAYISISDNQRQSGPEINYLATVYNGISPQNYPFVATPSPEPYLAFLGRMSPEKGPHHAIQVAKATGWKLKMAGKIDVTDQDFFQEQVKPLIDGEQIEFLSEISHAQKVELLGNATATLFPITWPEPFGLVMIESMCTGTPVLGTAIGSAPEVIRNGVSGYACNSVEAMIEALSQVIKLDRNVCHQYAVDHFSITNMIDGYLNAYEKLLTSNMETIQLASANKLAS